MTTRKPPSQRRVDLQPRDLAILDLIDKTGGATLEQIRRVVSPDTSVTNMYVIIGRLTRPSLDAPKGYIANRLVLAGEPGLYTRVGAEAPAPGTYLHRIGCVDLMIDALLAIRSKSTPVQEAISEAEVNRTDARRRRADGSWHRPVPVYSIPMDRTSLDRWTGTEPVHAPDVALVLDRAEYLDRESGLSRSTVRQIAVELELHAKAKAKVVPVIRAYNQAHRRGQVSQVQWYVSDWSTAEAYWAIIQDVTAQESISHQMGGQAVAPVPEDFHRFGMFTPRHRTPKAVAA